MAIAIVDLRVRGVRGLICDAGLLATGAAAGGSALLTIGSDGAVTGVGATGVVRGLGAAVVAGAAAGNDVTSDRADVVSTDAGSFAGGASGRPHAAMPSVRVIVMRPIFIFILRLVRTTPSASCTPAPAASVDRALATRFAARSCAARRKLEHLHGLAAHRPNRDVKRRAETAWCHMCCEEGAAARDLLAMGSSDSSLRDKGRTPMKYGLAWLLGIPIPILAVVYLVSHC